MGTAKRIPVKVHRPDAVRAALGTPSRTPPSAPQQDHAVAEPEQRQQRPVTAGEPLDIMAETMDNVPKPAAREEEVDYWRDRALRLQAEMENYRRRQGRLAQDQVDTQRQQLLAAFLEIVDNLERALAVPRNGDHDLSQGLELTHRAAVQLLERQGVEPVQALGQPFDPNWHEAIATVGRDGSGAAAETVVKVLEPGYRLDGRLLRPAKVVVAV